MAPVRCPGAGVMSPAAAGPNPRRPVRPGRNARGQVAPGDAGPAGVADGVRQGTESVGGPAGSGAVPSPGERRPDESPRASEVAEVVRGAVACRRNIGAGGFPGGRTRGRWRHWAAFSSFPQAGSMPTGETGLRKKPAHRKVRGPRNIGGGQVRNFPQHQGTGPEATSKRPGNNQSTHGGDRTPHFHGDPAADARSRRGRPTTMPDRLHSAPWARPHGVAHAGRTRMRARPAPLAFRREEGSKVPALN